MQRFICSLVPGFQHAEDGSAVAFGGARDDIETCDGRIVIDPLHVAQNIHDFVHHLYGARGGGGFRQFIGDVDATFVLQRNEACGLLQKHRIGGKNQQHQQDDHIAGMSDCVLHILGIALCSAVEPIVK